MKPSHECPVCFQSTTNPKFCSRSCAAKRNNVLHPKRAMRPCTECGMERTDYKTAKCLDCHRKSLKRESLNRYQAWTLGEMRGDGSVNFNCRYPYIRTMSRRAYKESGRPMECLVCNYSLHVDIAHVRDVKSYPDTATVAEVNDLSNLIALCKNHHWEFDNGYLQIEGISSETKPEIP